MKQTINNPNEVKAIFPLKENSKLISKVADYDLTKYPEYNMILFKGPLWAFEEISSILCGGVVG